MLPTSMASKRLHQLSLIRRLSSSSSSSFTTLVKPKSSFPSKSRPLHLLQLSSNSRPLLPPLLHYRNFFFSSPSLNINSTDIEGPTAIDYSSILQEDEFHSLADSTIHDLQEKFEEYGDSVQIDGFDIDYGNEVLTLKLGDLGTYVLNKQTPNRQLWLSSPVSGPSRFDWDQSVQAWVYRRTKANLLKVFESELEQLCGEPVKLS